MLSVIFEVRPNEGRKDEYLGLAKELKPILESMDGFLDNERFESRLRPGWMLSHSTWRDENSVIRWRMQGEHRAVQAKGRFEVFQDYHLRVGEVIAEDDPRREAPIRERRLDGTKIGQAKIVTLTEMTPVEGSALETDFVPTRLGLDLTNAAIVQHDIFESIYNPGKLVLLIGWRSLEAASSWRPKKADGIDRLRHRQIRIVRDYGRFDRREAPQFYPDVQDAEGKHATPPNG